METRYWLTIEGGKRRGESFSIPPTGCLLGRDSSADLQLPEASVSGKHARLDVEADGVRVTDLESRNGVRVNGERVKNHLMAHADQLSLGKLQLTLRDRTVAGSTTENSDPLVSGSSLAESSEQKLHSLSASSPNRRAVPALIKVLVGVLVAAGGFQGWQLLQKSDAIPRRTLPVALVPGELLADGSFEESATLQSWETEPETSLELAPVYRHRGETGLGVDLTEAQSFRLTSPWSAVREGRALRVSAQVRGATGLELSSGLELGKSSDPSARLELRGGSLSTSDEFRELTMTEAILPGFDRARLVFRVSAANPVSLSLDDVSVSEVAMVDPVALKFEEFELYRHGADATSASLVRIGRVVASELRFFTEEGESPLGIQELATGWELGARSSELGTRFSFLIADSLSEFGLATLHRGAGRRRLSAGKATEVSGVLAGEGTLLVRFGFAEPVELHSERAPQGWRLTTGSIRGPVELQLSFRDVRNRAADLADAARRADRSDSPSESLKLWAELLESVPFDAELVAEGEAARGRQLRIGLDQVEAVRAEFTRARFFNLPEIYRRNADRVSAIGKRYAGSEVAEEAARLAGEINAELAGHVDEEQAEERERLARVAQALQRSGAGELAEHVRAEASAAGEDHDHDPSHEGGTTDV